MPEGDETMNEELLAILKEMLPTWKEVVIDGGCDHSVGICVCPDIALADRAETVIKKIEGGTA
jgi:hypothetical protein